ncbi:hypothetical protein [Carnimonas bestiolae]|uniref:hypothetical protein n=1 Tax=Carnimonas bestiolae TaxID=3402172 RepID=UPI003EDC979A
MSVIEITRAQAMCICALEEHKDAPDKVNIYHLERPGRWVHSNQNVFSFLPHGIDGNDQAALQLLSNAKEFLTKARGEQ